MNISFKVAISLLVSILFFAGFTVLAYTDLFDLIETRFYNPSIARSSGQKIGDSARAIGNFLSELQARFAASLAEDPVRSSFILNQRVEDIFERSRIYGTMLESQGGLQAVRFVDAGGSRIHFSTSPQDILRQDQGSIAYRAYNDGGGELPFEELAIPSQGGNKIVFDQAGERLIFSFPFYDSLDVYRGSALFYLSVRAITERLIREGLGKMGDDVSVVANPGGFVLGLPSGGKHALVPLIASVWNEGILSPAQLVSGEAPVSLVLVSAKTGDIFAGILLDESLFAISPVMKVILLASFFFTVYLVVFLFFNLRQDPVTVLENRLKRLRIALLEHYYDTTEETERNHWNRELEQRREETLSELKRGLKTKGKDLDRMLDRSWDEFLSIINRPRQGLDKEILDRILTLSSSTPPLTDSGPTPAPALSPATEKPGTVPEPSAGIEELEELEELEEFEELEEVGEMEEPKEPGEAAGKPEGLEELEEMEELEELEEFDEEPAELEELDEEPSGESPAGTPMTGAQIDEIASKIEFADSTREEDAGEDLPMNLDIASPFDLMVFEPDGGNDELPVEPGQTDPGPDGNMPPPGKREGEKKNSLQALTDEGEEELEELAVINETGLEELDSQGGLPYIYPPFSLDSFQNLAPLKVLPDDSPVSAVRGSEDKKNAAPGMRVIEEREGLHYISDDTFKEDRKTEQTLDREFKDLVDSVLGEKAGPARRPGRIDTKDT